MNYQPIAAAVVAVSGLTSLYIQNRRTTMHAAEEIKRELEILAALPQGSALQEPLQTRVEDSLRRYIARKKDGVRDWSGATLAAILMVGAAFFGWMIADKGGWWWTSLVIAAPFAVFGVYGIVESLGVAQRDASGRRIQVDDGGSS
ncbi:hypothetical protein [Streptomyces sp. NPDC055210]